MKRLNTESTEAGAQRAQRRVWVFAIVAVVALSSLRGSIQGQTQRAALPSSTLDKPDASAVQTPLQKNVEAYLRRLYALGPKVQLTVSAPKESEVPGLLETTVDVKDGENSQAAKFYLSKDGKYLVRGEVSDLSKDPIDRKSTRLNSSHT